MVSSTKCIISQSLTLITVFFNSTSISPPDFICYSQSLLFTQGVTKSNNLFRWNWWPWLNIQQQMASKCPLGHTERTQVCLRGWFPAILGLQHLQPAKSRLILLLKGGIPYFFNVSLDLKNVMQHCSGAHTAQGYYWWISSTSISIKKNQRKFNQVF